MKINKIFLMAGLAVMGLVATSCGDDDDNYTPGKPAGNNNVVFINQAGVIRQFFCRRGGGTVGD